MTIKAIFFTRPPSLAVGGRTKVALHLPCFRCFAVIKLADPTGMQLFHTPAFLGASICAIKNNRENENRIVAQREGKIILLTDWGSAS